MGRRSLSFSHLTPRYRPTVSTSRPVKLQDGGIIRDTLTLLEITHATKRDGGSSSAAVADQSRRTKLADTLGQSLGGVFSRSPGEGDSQQPPKVQKGGSGLVRATSVRSIEWENVIEIYQVYGIAYTAYASCLRPMPGTCHTSSCSHVQNLIVAETHL
jgi:hypothetical protein